MENSHLKLLKFPDAKELSYERAIEVITANLHDPETAAAAQDEVVLLLFNYFTEYEEDFYAVGVAQKLLDLQAIISYFWAIDSENEQ